MNSEQDGVAAAARHLGNSDWSIRAALQVAQADLQSSGMKSDK